VNPKFLENSSGRNLLPTKFEIVEVEKNTIMLKTKVSHFGFLRTLDKWLKSNYFMEELSYRGKLWDRSSSMRQWLS
jgi:hypothetical protein